MTEYVDTGKVRYVFVDYPIAQLHPDAFKAHEAAACAGDQGKYWEMHNSLFENPPARDAAQFDAQAKAIGLDLKKFDACLSSQVHAPAIRESIERMQQLGVGGTPLTLIGLTPAKGAPLKVLASVYGARPLRGLQDSARRALAQPSRAVAPSDDAEAAAAGQERARGDLAVEGRAPAAGDGRGAVRARPIGRDPVAPNQVAVALDQQRLAAVAAGVLQVADAAGQVAGVDVAQAVRAGRSPPRRRSISGVVLAGSCIR